MGISDLPGFIYRAEEQITTALRQLKMSAGVFKLALNLQIMNIISLAVVIMGEYFEMFGHESEISKCTFFNLKCHWNVVVVVVFFTFFLLINKQD